MISIDKNIPIPAPKNVGRPRQYPFHIMEIGDSFFAPDKSAITVSRAAQAVCKRLGRKFVVRAVDGGVRVWRIE